MRALRVSVRIGGIAMLLCMAGCGSAVSVTGGPSGSAVAGSASSGSAGGSPAAPTTAAPAALAAAADRCAAAGFAAPLAPRDAPAAVHTYPAAPAMQINASRVYEATITTSRGSIVLCLDPQLAPATVNNFVVLARNHFYDGLTFHRVVPDFVIQGGDPTGTGSGGPGYQFKDEPVRAAYSVGAVAMANAGPDTNGSQFFICIGSQCPPLPPLYSLFGVVHSGQDVAGRIAAGDVMTTVTVAEST